MSEQLPSFQENGYTEDASPEEEVVEVFDMSKEVPDSIPIPDENIGYEEPNPEDYDRASQYIHDLLEHEVGFQADQAAEDPANPGQISKIETSLEGDIMDVKVDEYGVKIFYRLKDKIFQEPEEIETLDDMPEKWADVEFTQNFDFNASNFLELREKTKQVARYLQERDEELSNRKNP